MYEYKCNIVKVVDGDTVDVDIDLGFDVWLRNERVRFAGIDAPESRTSDPVEKVFGLAAKAEVERLLENAEKITLLSKDFKGKFGRILGDFKLEKGEVSNEDTLCGQLLIEGHAVLYTGQSKDEIEAHHLRNRRILIETGQVDLTLEEAGIA